MICQNLNNQIWIVGLEELTGSSMDRKKRL
jgi:hypothetical protein